MKLGIVADPIETLNREKDSTLAICEEAKKRGYKIFYMEPTDLFLKDGKAFGKTMALSELDVILMRKDPPVDIYYINITYILEQAEREGVLVFNKPQSLRDCNEKLFIESFIEFTPPHCVTSQICLIKTFFEKYKDIIVKPLDNMGGTNILHITSFNEVTEKNLSKITDKGLRHVMIQQFVPEVFNGDKRIIMIQGEPIPHALARIPKPGDFRGNLAAGGSYEPRELTKRDKEICKVVGPILKEKGLIFVGLDIIGDYLTEINVTSPTCIREFDALFNINVSAMLLDAMSN